MSDKLECTMCRCKLASRRDFFAGVALAGILAGAKDRGEVFHRCITDDLQTAQLAFRIGRTMDSRARLEDGAR